MDIRELEIFLTVADLLHFGRASQACNLSPSALTRTIQRLEDEIEQPLFVRDNRRVALTPAGERFRDYARRSVQEWKSFRGAVKGTEAISGTLSIYASVTAVYSLLPRLLEAFRSAHRDVQLELSTGAAERAVAQVQNGEIDLAVAALPDRQQAHLEFLPIISTPLLFIAPRQKEGLPLPLRDGQLDLRRTPLVVPQKGLSRRRLDQWLRTRRILPNITSEVSGNEALIAMVRLGCGIGIVPELVLARSPFRDEVRILETAPQLSPYVVGLCSTRRNLQRPVVRAFWQLAEKRSGVKVDF
ncbi:MAG: HTH-type transcriptional activator IlvY [Syntrophotalea acetylenica]|jgi:LysR family positive regulator for ilvC|uniref:Transcriptional regulator IlvY n=1 Tax=Syntrophotalea acetylenica TaxID=29542 RepID=A0A1L3GGV2_SYNAC|nr:HTH-type transcriptional activator IlvY [Syntrophotalea acetylenica]APG25085.1 transcriptional regulator IlvY [Syntrophotalea acetylenica]APG43156.1 transcriptional regulator IlvY [Syntrophotalea acetylenica]MDD4457174.1 HTH-type transcriptional activator IlvY [Syntrophotalea acetylenica]MDY0260920.1 HTH-type transcriptional activator IlvY [Syntrophotalea acetylenica]